MSVEVINCDTCLEPVGANPNNAALWNGFYDSDTNMHVCWSCKQSYYKFKTKELGKQGLYSEMPVTLSLNYK